MNGAGQWSMLKKVIPAVIILAVVLIYTIDLFSGLGGSPELVTLSQEEMTEYNGIELSSIMDFRENSIRGAPLIDPASYRLKVGGLVASPAEYTYDEVLILFPQTGRVATLHCVEGWDITAFWEGTPLWEIINKSEPMSGANTVIIHAADGYSSSFPLEYIKKPQVLLSYRINGVVTPREIGFPFILTADEKWGYKWVRWVEEIELSDDLSYRGYWESRGYSNTADTNKSFFAE